VRKPEATTQARVRSSQRLNKGNDMQLTPELIFGFSEAYLRGGYDNPKPTPDFHIDLWKLMCRPEQHIAAAAPRGHAKSTAVTHAFGLAALLFGWKSHLLIVSGTEGQASAFLKNMAMEMTYNTELMKDFGIQYPFEKDSATEIIVRVGKEGRKIRVIAKGSNQAIRGTLWEHKRPDIVICDDLETDDIVMNKDRRNKFKEWFLSVLYPAVSDTGIYRVVGTILHMDSLLEGMMPKKVEGYPVISEPLVDYTHDPDPEWFSVRFRAHDKEFDNILWPDQFSKEKLQGIKRRFTGQGVPDKYAQEYLNYPIDDSTAYIKKDDLLPMLPDDFDKNMKYYVGVDFALSKTTSADYTVFVIVGVDDQGTFYVVDVRRARWDTYEIVDEFFSVQSRYSPGVFYVEKGTIWLAVEAMLQNEMYKPQNLRGGQVNYDPVGVSQDKLIRARPLQHRTRAGAIRFNKEAGWYEDFELELLRFPRAAHDDQVDALAHLCQQIVKLQFAATPEEEADAEYNKQVSSSLTFSGRTSIGGY